MPKKIKGQSSKRQAQSAQLAAKDIASNAKSSQKLIEQRRRSIESSRKALQRSEDKKLKETLKTIRGMGIYEPKSADLTPYRRGRLRKVQREYKEILEPGKFFLIPLKSRPDRKTIISRSETIGIQTTRFGLIVPTNKHKRVRLKTNKHGEVFIDRSGKTKQGPNRGRVYHDTIPIASLDELELQKDRLRRAAKRMGKLKDNERLYFVVKEHGFTGKSNRSFPNIEELFRYLDTYDQDQKSPDGRVYKKGKSKAAMINLYRHVHLIKMTSEDHKIAYPDIPGKRKTQRQQKGRRTDTRRSK